MGHDISKNIPIAMVPDYYIAEPNISLKTCSILEYSLRNLVHGHYDSPSNAHVSPFTNFYTVFFDRLDYLQKSDVTNSVSIHFDNDLADKSLFLTQLIKHTVKSPENDLYARKNGKWQSEERTRLKKFVVKYCTIPLECFVPIGEALFNSVEECDPLHSPWVRLAWVQAYSIFLKQVAPLLFKRAKRTHSRRSLFIHTKQKDPNDMPPLPKTALVPTVDSGTESPRSMNSSRRSISSSRRSISPPRRSYSPSRLTPPRPTWPRRGSERQSRKLSIDTSSDDALSRPESSSSNSSPKGIYSPAKRNWFDEVPPVSEGDEPGASAWKSEKRRKQTLVRKMRRRKLFKNSLKSRNSAYHYEKQLAELIEHLELKRSHAPSGIEPKHRRPRSNSWSNNAPTARQNHLKRNVATTPSRHRGHSVWAANETRLIERMSREGPQGNTWTEFLMSLESGSISNLGCLSE